MEEPGQEDREAFLPKGRGAWNILYKNKSLSRLILFLGNNFNIELIFKTIQIIKFI